jgi:lipopolysaccharide/colanic/teichoic acid biosynthesis glycosyltransferase
MKKEELTKAQRWAIADKLAQERLPGLNATLADVIPSDTFYARYGKRVLDVCISGCALLVCIPINLIVGIATFFDVGRPIFFRQQRVGRNGELFTIIKFRNMRNTTDEKGELLPPEQRVTKFGKFVRKTSIDELLNFWSILKGDMSILGPRPLVPEYTHRYNKRHRMRLAVRPGLECPPRKLDGHVWTWQEQLDNDVWYVENLSFRTDCMMFWNLVKFTFDRKSAAARAVAKRGTFMGYDENGIAINLDGVPQEYVEDLAQGICG